MKSYLLKMGLIANHPFKITKFKKHAKNEGYTGNKYTKPFGGQVGVGMYLPDNFRADLTVGLVEQQFKTTSTRVTTVALVDALGAIVSTNTTTVTGPMKFNLKAIPVMINGYYDVMQWNGVTPYVTAGLGVSFLQLKVKTHEVGGGVEKDKGKSNVQFAYNAGVGASYAINEKISADVGYRYSNLGRVHHDSGAKKIGNISMHQALLGLRVNF